MHVDTPLSQREPTGVTHLTRNRDRLIGVNAEWPRDQIRVRPELPLQTRARLGELLQRERPVL